MQKNFWLNLALIVCASNIQITMASEVKFHQDKQRKTKKSHKFQKNDSLSKHEKKKKRNSIQENSDDRYAWQINGSHKLNNPLFPLRSAVDPDQTTVHPGRTTTKVAAYSDQEAP